MNRLRPLLPLVLVFIIAPLPAGPLYSPTWGFSLDLPEGYQFSGGDGKDRFSFSSPWGGTFDLAVYGAGRYPSAEALAEDAGRRLGNRGDRSPFVYRDREAVLMELDFPDPASPGGGRLRGWALALELEPAPSGAGPGKALLLALAYGEERLGDLTLFHLSALDSIAPGAASRRVPGPVTEFAYPRGEGQTSTLALTDLSALWGEGDAEGAQALVDREYRVLNFYAEGPLWQEAWIRFYRGIYRDSFERLEDAALVLERHWRSSPPAGREGDGGEERDFAGKALAWVQSFTYERDQGGSDFVNLVSAAAEGRGDCDSRALLWAIILEQAGIPAGIMVSREYGHAMGLAELPGAGARFEAGGKKWLVAETTAAVALGLIGQEVSETAKWLGVLFE